jgi:hypothetical protein
MPQLMHHSFFAPWHRERATKVLLAAFRAQTPANFRKRLDAARAHYQQAKYSYAELVTWGLNSFKRYL